MFGNIYPVKADIERIDSYSGHADYSEMIRFRDCQDKTLVKKLILVHGEYSAQRFFSNKLDENGFPHAESPELGAEITV